MVPEDEKDLFKKAVATKSERYGNNTSIKDVFDKPIHPQSHELVEALAETPHLSKKEAFAFVWSRMEGGPRRKQHSDVTDRFLEDNGFDDLVEFDSVRQSAQAKIADAIWIYELIDAYRFPDFPEECEECGNALGGAWVGEPDDDDSTVRCIDCADIDEHQGQYYRERLSNDE